MVTCSGCGAVSSESVRFCSSCGRAIAILDPPTLEPDRTAVVPPPTPPGSHPPPSVGFAPGTILVDRYRIVALLGRGGMGEVYRAEDLKLGNVVALKFLPASLQSDAASLAGFHAEVRNARQVSHPNVCRVYDIGEVNGQHFLTMEYIDGEDLASLLRRIGRLPADKALETAHQICAGLAAAHDCGLLHRDLKPANIMLDGRGRVRITDFGLALSNDDAMSRSETAGTPAYMAPEQIAKGQASVRSDIYSLGLVFYELFTGRLPYQASTLVEWRRAHVESSPQESVVGNKGHRFSRGKGDPALPGKRSGEAPRVGTASSSRVSGRRPPGRCAGSRGNAFARNGRRFGGDRRPAPRGGLGCTGRSNCVCHGGNSVEWTNNALPARAARKTAGGAG